MNDINLIIDPNANANVPDVTLAQKNSAVKVIANAGGAGIEAKSAAKQKKGEAGNDNDAVRVSQTKLTEESDVPVCRICWGTEEEDLAK